MKYKQLIPQPRYTVIRAEFVFPLSTNLPKYTRIEDGYLLSDFDKIIEVG